ncbi:hypothetical protein D3C80_827620 [compost metagenome]
MSKNSLSDAALDFRPFVNQQVIFFVENVESQIFNFFDSPVIYDRVRNLHVLFQTIKPVLNLRTVENTYKSSPFISSVREEISGALNINSDSFGLTQQKIIRQVFSERNFVFKHQ